MGRWRTKKQLQRSKQVQEKAAKRELPQELQLLRSLPTPQEWAPLPAVDVEEDEEAKLRSLMVPGAAMEMRLEPQSPRL